MRIREVQNYFNNIILKNLILKRKISSDYKVYEISDINITLAEVIKLKQHKIPLNIINEWIELLSSLEMRKVIKLEEHNQLEAIENTFVYGIPFFIDLTEKIIPASNENNIYIKLPNTTNISEISDFLLEIEKKISSVIINDDINGEVKFSNFDNGSIWVEIFLGSIIAVRCIGSIAWAATVVYKKKQEASIIKQQVETLNIKNDSLKDLQNGLSEAIKLLIEAEAKNVQDMYYSDCSNHEMLERLKHTIKTFAELIEKGAEIHPSLTAPETVDNLFPKNLNLESIVSQIKQLENKSK